ncbi:MAG: efflux RND transporter periplasmic adaptor subunit [Acidobacteria bacterium]|nr:efflux RND transporter periplasmic adaptor subunit [Acidobacteriota bacterium]
MRPESDDPASAVIVKDPIRRKFYRFTQIQAAVLRALDGTRSAESAARHVSDHYQTSVETTQVEDFAEKLRGLLLLDDPSCWAKLQLEFRPKRGLFRSLLQIRLHAFNPDALLTHLENSFRFFYSSGFGLFASASMCLALCLTILNWEALSVSIRSLISFYSIPLVLAVILAVMTIHEFAHGLTLKHFGGKVEEMGFMLLYFIPAFYCNVSDAWMLPKRQRILVTLAGGYAQLCVWAWATVAWRLLAPETFLSSLFAVTIAFSGVQTLFNFMPLIRLDGYYLLSDWLEVPNLRARSFGFLRANVSRWILGEGAAARVEPARHRRIYVLYGIASLLFSAGLAWFMIDRLGGWLVREYQAWGLVLTLAIILMVVPAPGKEEVKSGGRFAGKVVVRIQKTPLLVILLLILVASAFLPWELKVSGDFTILPKNKVTINPEIEGTLKAIHVDEGNRVKAGDVLAEMRNLELQNSYEETKGELASKAASLELLRAGSRPEEIERAVRLVETKRAELANVTRVQQERAVLQEAVARKEAELDNAYKNYERSRRLLADGLIARNEVERDQTIYAVRQKELSEALGQLKVLDERIERTRDVKRKELAEAESELKILKAGSRKEAIQAVEAEVAKLQEKFRILARQVEQLTIRSPMDGIVATPYLRNRIGEYLRAGGVLCEIVSSSSVIVDMPVPEKEIADVKLGYPIVLKVRGFPQLTFGAKVRSISPVAVDRGLERKVVVQGELDNPEGILRAGMTGVGKILCGKRMIGNLLTRRAIRWLRTEFWEYLP